MFDDDEQVSADLAFVIKVATDAANRALEARASVQPREKDNHSYVTNLDLELERFIRRRLGERFPSDAVTGEELAATGGDSPRRWSIDPIDGTGNLVHGLPLWAISIGLVEDGEPVLGVIAVPPLGEVFWATRNGGAWRDGVRIDAEDAAAFHSQDNVCVGTNALRTLDPRSLPGRLRDLGTACCELAFTACGRLQACTFLGEAAHDVVAGAVIVHEAGCRVATIDGRYLTPAEFVAETPVSIPTFIAPPQRLEALLRVARRLS